MGTRPRQRPERLAVKLLTIRQRLGLSQRQLATQIGLGKQGNARVCEYETGVREPPFHDLRHTFGTRLADAGVDVVKIKELMGHASIVTTMRYIHATDQGKRAAIVVLSEYRQNRRHKFVTDEKRQALQPAVNR